MVNVEYAKFTINVDDFAKHDLYSDMAEMDPKL